MGPRDDPETDLRGHDGVRDIEKELCGVVPPQSLPPLPQVVHLLVAHPLVAPPRGPRRHIQ